MKIFYFQIVSPANSFLLIFQVWQHFCVYPQKYIVVLSVVLKVQISKPSSL